MTVMTEKLLGQINKLEVRLAATPQEIRASQYLRYSIFYDEMSAIPDAEFVLAIVCIPVFGVPVKSKVLPLVRYAEYPLAFSKFPLERTTQPSMAQAVIRVSSNSNTFP